MNERPLIAIARGGYSGESVVSMQSAQQMMDSVDVQQFEPIFLTIHKDDWRAFDQEENLLDFDRGEMTVTGRSIEGVIIAIHGTPGEDGLLQGYLDMLSIPFQTGDVLNMSLTFSKFSTTGLLRQLGYPVSDSVMISAFDELDEEKIIERLGLPCFVKPDRSGSSLGISKVKSKEELRPAVVKAFEESDMVMVEKAMTGREITCGIIGSENGPRALPLCEVITDREYFDFEAKYHAEGTQEIVPAPVSEEITKEIQERSIAIYKALGCRGMARIDHFLNGSDIMTIEANTVPGFSEASILPKMLRADGLGVEQAVNEMIREMLTN